MASFPPPLQILLISYFNPNNFINASSFDYTITDTRYLKKNGDTSYGTIIAPNFTGLASNSTNINLTNETLQNSGCLIPFSITATGNQPLKTNSNLNYNPNTGIFNVGYISTTGSITSGSAMTAGGLLTSNGGLIMNNGSTSPFILQTTGSLGCIRMLNNSTSNIIQSGTSSSASSLPLIIASTQSAVPWVTISSTGLTMGGSNNITLGDGTSAPQTGQLGYTYNPTINWTTPGAFTAITTSQLVPAGTWLITLNIGLNGTYTANNYIYFGSSLSNVKFPVISLVYSTTTTAVCSGTYVFNFLTATSVQMYNALANGQTLAYGYFSITRIG